MIDLEDFAEEYDEAITKAWERLSSGTVEHRHIMPGEQKNLIVGAVFYREMAKQFGLHILQMEEEAQKRGEEAMKVAKDPCRRE